MRWITVLLAILLFGCIDKMKIPPDIIMRPKMEKILWEMTQADRFVSSYIQTRKDTLGRNKKEAVDVYDKVFNFNGITRQEFLTSYKFYLGRPDILKIMFDSISVRAERKKAEVYMHPKAKIDSLRIKNDSITKKQLSKPRLP